ncbi:MAG: SRPBCC domain-containing protein [Pseudomonadota bacterium]
MTTDLSLRVTRFFAATPERVFDAWLDPAKLVLFITPDPTLAAPDVTVDPAEGGRFDIIMKGTNRDLPHWGVYREIRRPEKLVFTWESEFSIAGSTVTLTLEPEGDGTRLTLTHEHFSSEEIRDNHEEGWSMITDHLAKVVEGVD